MLTKLIMSAFQSMKTLAALYTQNYTHKTSCPNKHTRFSDLIKTSDTPCIQKVRVSLNSDTELEGGNVLKICNE